MINWLNLTCVHAERAFRDKVLRRFAVVALPLLALAITLTVL